MIIRICGITIIADYCLESITINRLIGDFDRRYRVSYDILQQINNATSTSAKSNVDVQRRLSFATVR